MKISPIIVGGLGALTLIECTYAHPGMATTVREIEQRVKRTVRPGFRLLIGDIKDGGSTPVGKSIARILLEQESGQSDETYTIPGALASAKCKADTCCVWAYVALDLTKLFRGPSGRCNENARTAIRLGFHDAGTWQEGLDFGGADGSIMLAREEIGRADNKGLQNIVSILRVLQLKYKPFGVGVADLIQFAAKHAVVTCPLGPRIRTFVGRKDSSRPSQNGLLPGVTDSADSLIALFRAKTISPHSLVALLGAHTTSTQTTVDPRRPGAPQDGTPGVWDTLFYNQTLGLGPMPKNVLRFQSDVVLAKDPRTAGEWERFSMGSDAQHHWNEDYAYSYIRVSMLGVGNVNKLVECTKVLPPAKKGFQGAGELL
ncbi:heme peroxidase, partial [Boeremia exigua]|uniref:heme peroxidase n=1 Tax=Boeremia exigua TaxID=749465 RepID=UPI001E8DC8CA